MNKHFDFIPPLETDGCDDAYLSWYEEDRYYDIMVLIDEAKNLLKVLTGNADADSIREIATILEEAENV